MKKIFSLIVSILIASSMVILSACSDNNTNLTTQSQSPSESIIEVNEQSSETSKGNDDNISNSSLSNEESSDLVEQVTSEEPSKIQSEPNIDNSSSNNDESLDSDSNSDQESSSLQSNQTTSNDESSEQLNLIDETKYPRPQIDDSKIICELFTYYVSYPDFINENTIDFIMEHFNGRVYEKDQLIDVKAELSSYDNPENYYDIYGCIYNIIKSKTLETVFEEITAKVDMYRFIYLIDEDNNLVLKPNQTFKLNMYLDEKELHFILSEV